MKYTDMKDKLLALFEAEKLKGYEHEWGIYHEVDREIYKIGYATSITPEIIEQAHEKKVEVLLTHHGAWDFVFGLKEKCNKLLEKYHITHAFFHAPLDDAAFGTSASLAKAIGMTDLNRVMPYESVFRVGVIGQVQPTSFDGFKKQLVTVLKEPIRTFKNNDKQVRKVCIATGGGNMTTEMQVAVDYGCDTYITGEYVLYSQQYAKLIGMNLLIGSHTGTEILGVKSMAELLTEDTGVHLIRIKEPND